MANCGTCGKELNADTTRKRPDSDTWRSPCNECRAKRRRELHDAQEAEVRFMVTREVCDICGQPERSKRNGVTKLLAKDHDHATGTWRGLLCERCNKGIGVFHDNVHLL